MSIAFVFTGQGIQEVGMGKDLYDAFPEKQYIFSKVDDLISKHITSICFNGPYEELIDAYNSGLAVFTVSVVIFEIIKDILPKPKAYAGYSMGQYSALFAADILSFEEALRSLDARSKCLKIAAAKSNSGMVGIIGIPVEKIEAIIAGIGKCYIANYNSPGNITISYDLSVKTQLYAALEEAQPIKVTDIPVEGGWHSIFMKPAAECFRLYLEKIKFNQPDDIIIDNYTADIIENTDQLRENLYYHIFHPVKWHQSVKKIIDLGIDTFIEIGYGNQLSKFIKFINRNVKVFQTGTVNELNKTIDYFNKLSD